VKYDIPKIKANINLLARALRENKTAFKQAQRERREPWLQAPAKELADQLEAAFLPRDLRQFRSNYSGAYLWGAVSIYFTRLCCLRASMRGRLHFSPNTRPATVEDLGIEWPLTLEDQQEWAECIAYRFELEDQPEVRAVG
jgi:hypothetical protein